VIYCQIIVDFVHEWLYTLDKFKGWSETLEKLRPAPMQPPSAKKVITMATLARTTHNVTHHAYYGDLYGTAELLNGSGYLFREDGQRKATVVSYKDPELMLLGLVDVSEMQHDIDLAVGGFAAVACGREEGRQ
jgi:hypothetical protein